MEEEKIDNIRLGVAKEFLEEKKAQIEAVKVAICPDPNSVKEKIEEI